MFQFKNETNQKVYLAFAYPIPPYSSPLIWMSEGWWHIEPNSTVTVYPKKLESRYYYYYAHSDGLVWKGDTIFNVSNLAFELKRDCIETYDTRLFKVIDTGGSRKFFVNLTDSSSSPLSEDEKELVKLIGEFKNKK
jgi:uncharacterized membrane protein